MPFGRRKGLPKVREDLVSPDIRKWFTGVAGVVFVENHVYVWEQDGDTVKQVGT